MYVVCDYLWELDREMVEICWGLKKDDQNELEKGERVCRNMRRFERESVGPIAFVFLFFIIPSPCHITSYEHCIVFLNIKFVILYKQNQNKLTI